MSRRWRRGVPGAVRRSARSRRCACGPEGRRTRNRGTFRRSRSSGQSRPRLARRPARRRCRTRSLGWPREADPECGRGPADRPRGAGFRQAPPRLIRHTAAQSRDRRAWATLQIDSVNVFARSHYMPLFSRVGAYDTAALDRLLFARRAPYVEYWAHVAVLHPRGGLGAVPLPHGRHAGALRRTCGRVVRRRTARSSSGCAPNSPRADRSAPQRSSTTRKRRVAVRGGTGTSSRTRSSTCGSSARWRSPVAADSNGATASLSRSSRPRCSPRPVDRDDAVRELVRARPPPYGVATASDLADYWRIRDRRRIMAAIADLESVGELQPVEVVGLDQRRPAGEGVGAPRMRHSPAASTRPPSSRRSTPSCGSAIAPSGSSTSSTASRSTRPRPSGASATTRCPSWSATIVVGRIDLKADRAASDAARAVGVVGARKTGGCRGPPGRRAAARRRAGRDSKTSRSPAGATRPMTSPM